MELHKTIHRYQLNCSGLREEVKMPEGAELLTVDVRDGDVHLWAQVDTRNPEKTRLVTCYGTGQPTPNNPGKYIGTTQLFSGKLVLHWYDLGYKGFDEAGE